MCFRFLQVAWSFVRTGELPHHDHGHVDGIAEETRPPAPGQEDRIYRMDDDLHPRPLDDDEGKGGGSGESTGRDERRRP
jgi:C4-dicarboxylate transporter DctQ subunit